MWLGLLGQYLKLLKVVELGLGQATRADLHPACLDTCLHASGNCQCAHDRQVGARTTRELTVGTPFPFPLQANKESRREREAKLAAAWDDD